MSSGESNLFVAEPSDEERRIFALESIATSLAQIALLMAKLWEQFDPGEDVKGYNDLGEGIAGMAFGTIVSGEGDINPDKEPKCESEEGCTFCLKSVE
jgi:hypothetical protein